MQTKWTTDHVEVPASEHKLLADADTFFDALEAGAVDFSIYVDPVDIRRDAEQLKP